MSKIQALQKQIEERLVSLQEDVELLNQRGEFDQLAMFDLDESVRLLSDLTLELFSVAG